MKFKKNLCAILAVCVLGVSASTAVFADATTQSSLIGISFKGGEGPTEPVDPENPENPDPDPDPTPVEGDLAIVKVSDFIFGEVVSIGTGGTYYIDAEELPNAQVVDLRGSGAGWTLNAALSPISNEDDEIIAGASITIDKGRPNSTVSSEYAPDMRTAQLKADSTVATVMAAERGKGMGLWVGRFYEATTGDSTVSITIPEGFLGTGAYTGTITWTLLNTPVA